MSLHTTPQFEGSLPSCLLSMPRLRTLLLSSNGFTGQLDDNNMVLGRVLSQLDLSHNLLSGPIPDTIQYHNWSVLDLSHNKLNGVLNAQLLAPREVTIKQNGSTITAHSALYLDTNRLSGPVPNSVKQLQSNLSVLAGNLFQCRYDKTDLPQHDSDVDEYECASNSFNLSIYLWLGLVLVTLIWASCCISIWGLSKMEAKSKPLSQLQHWLRVVNAYSQVHHVAMYCSAFCLSILLPYYAVVRLYYGTHTHAYAYIVSAIYTSGVIPFAVTAVLLLLMLVSTMVYFISNTHGNEKVDPREVYPWRKLAFVWFVFVSANTIIVLGSNILFVYIVLYQSSEAQTIAQVALSVFKLVWSMEVSPYMMRKLDAYCHPDSGAQTDKHRHNYFTLQLLVGLFNNIAIPCLVVMAIDPNCFGEILLPPGPRTVYYLLPECVGNGYLYACQRQVLELTSLRFTPPFTYSYQCSASFITAYAPAFVYMSISNVFLHPVLQYVLLRVYLRADSTSFDYKFASWSLPRLLKPPSQQVQENQQKPSIIGASGVLVTLFTQLGILLTFGAIFPPVALAMTVSIASIVYLTRFKVQRFVQAAVDAQLVGYLQVINAECAGVGTREQMQLAVKIIVCYCCAFYTLFLFDALGDAEGFATSVWVLIVVPLLPIILFVFIAPGKSYCVHSIITDGDPTAPLPASVEMKYVGSNEVSAINPIQCIYD